MFDLSVGAADASPFELALVGFVWAAEFARAAEFAWAAEFARAAKKKATCFIWLVWPFSHNFSVF